MLGQDLAAKYQRLVDDLRSLDAAVVAFSGGVDSALLLHAAHEALGDRVLAITARSRLFPQRELDEAVTFCEERGIAQRIIQTHELEDERFVRNAPDRCYLCKRGMLELVTETAREAGIGTVVEGSNLDDESEYRPGSQAVLELGVKSPLRDAGLTKPEIRALSRELGLPTWDKQSFACLATRIEPGEPIRDELLETIDRAEQVLIERGFRQVRVRHHGSIARIELGIDELGRALENRMRREIVCRLKELGFAHVVLDLEGYKTGSMSGGQPDAL